MASETKPSQPGARRFRAVDVLTGAIDRAEPPRRARKQISAYLTPEQIRTLGELHARLSSGTTERVEKSEIVGLAIEVLAALITDGEGVGQAFTSLAAVRAHAMAHCAEK